MLFNFNMVTWLWQSKLWIQTCKTPSKMILCRIQLVRIGWVNTGCLKIDVTHGNDNDLQLRQAQWWSFRTRPVKNTFFELETSNHILLELLSNQLPGHAIFKKCFVLAINHHRINGLYLFWNSFKWFCL